MLTVQAAIHQRVQPASSRHSTPWLATIQMSPVLLLLIQQVRCNLIIENISHDVAQGEIYHRNLECLG